MKKRLTFFFFIFLFSFSGFSQSQPVIVLERTYGGPETEISRMVRIMPDGGYLIGGDRYDDEPNGDIYLVRTDADGDVMWDVSYGGPERERMQWAMNNGMQLTYDDYGNLEGIIVIGTTLSYGAGNRDFYVVKMDTEGQLDPSWPVNPRTFGGPDDDYGRTLRQTADGGYILVGQTWNPIDAYVIKLDKFGNMMWQKTYRLNSWSNAQDVIQTADGGYLITGTGGSTQVGVFLMKIDAAGNATNDYSKSFTGGGSQYDAGGGTYETLFNSGWGYNVEATSDGGHILAGSINGVQDGYLVKLDATGAIEWKKVYARPGANYTYGIQEVPTGGYVVVGETNGMGAGGWDFWYFHTDSDGTVIWEDTYGGPGSEWATCVQRTPDNGYAITGLNGSFGAGNGDFLLLKILNVQDPSYISGTLYIDENNDCVFTSGDDTPLIGEMVQLEPGPFFTFTDRDGNYKFTVEGGQYYTVSPVLDGPYITDPCAPASYSFNAMSGQTEAGINFALEVDQHTCLTATHIVSIGLDPLDPTVYDPLRDPYCMPSELTPSSPCPGYRHRYQVAFCNKGTFNINMGGSGLLIDLPAGIDLSGCAGTDSRFFGNAGVRDRRHPL